MPIYFRIRQLQQAANYSKGVEDKKRAFPFDTSGKKLLLMKKWTFSLKAAHFNATHSQANTGNHVFQLDFQHFNASLCR